MGIFWLLVTAIAIKDSGVNVALIMAASAVVTLAGGIYMWYVGHKWQKEREERDHKWQKEAADLAAKVASDSAAAVKKVLDIATTINVNVDGRLSEALAAMKELAHAQGRREGSEAERNMNEPPR